MPTPKPPSRDIPWDMSPREIVRKMQFLMNTNHVTVMQIAERTGVPKKQLQDILDGASLPTESIIRKCAEFFGVQVDFIMGREGSGATARGAAPAKAGTSSGRPATAKPGGAGPRRAGKPSGALNIRAIATRHQALVELLIEKGIISARDYHEMVQKIEKRSR